MTDPLAALRWALDYIDRHGGVDNDYHDIERYAFARATLAAPAEGLRERLEAAMDVGIYPENPKGGDDQRTEWQEGWNAASIAIEEAVDKVWAQPAAPDAALPEAAQAILDRALDVFDPDDLDPESSLAMPVTLKARWVYALRAALAAHAEGPHAPPSEDARLAVAGGVSPAVPIGNNADGASADVGQPGVEPFGTRLGDVIGTPGGEPTGSSHPASVGTGRRSSPSVPDWESALGTASRFHDVSVTPSSSALATAAAPAEGLPHPGHTPGTWSCSAECFAAPAEGLREAVAVCDSLIANDGQWQYRLEAYRAAAVPPKYRAALEADR